MKQAPKKRTKCFLITEEAVSESTVKILNSPFNLIAGKKLAFVGKQRNFVSDQILGNRGAWVVNYEKKDPVDFYLLDESIRSLLVSHKTNSRLIFIERKLNRGKIDKSPRLIWINELLSSIQKTCISNHDKVTLELFSRL
jgi:hypothetical protein